MSHFQLVFAGMASVVILVKLKVKFSQNKFMVRCHPKVHHCHHENPPSIPILKQYILLQPISLTSILILSLNLQISNLVFPTDSSCTVTNVPQQPLLPVHVFIVSILQVYCLIFMLASHRGVQVRFMAFLGKTRSSALQYGANVT